MAAAMLETPSRIWRRIQEVEAEDMPSLPSLPAFEDSADQASTISESMDLSNDSNPLTSTPATFKSSNTMATIRAPPSTDSTARFAQSIVSRSSKSSMALSASRGSVGRLNGVPKDKSFDISIIPSLPNILHRDELGDAEIHSSDQESKEDSVPDDYLPPIGIDTDHDGDFDLSDALRPLSRSNSPGPDLPGMTPKSKKKYDYSVSIKSEPRPSPLDRLRNVALRRPLSRNTRTPSLTRTETPSPSSSTSSQPTPQSTRSGQQRSADPHVPSPAHIPLPRSATASPMPLSTAFATPSSARAVPLPRSRTASPTAGAQIDMEHEQTAHTIMTETGDGMEEAPTSLPELPSDLEHDEYTMGTDIRTEEESEAREEREPTFSSEEGLTQTSRGGNDTISLRYQSVSPGAFSSPLQSTLLTPTPAFQPRPRARFDLNPVQATQNSTTPPDAPANHQQDLRLQEREDTWQADRHASEQGYSAPATPSTSHKRSFLMSVINSTARPRMKFPTPHPYRTGVSETPVPATPAMSEDTQGDTTVTAIAARTAFAGTTPRPRIGARPRLSYPISHTWNGPPHASESEIGSAPGVQSPGGYDGAIDKASFISTASSQDLTTHARANASFDPVIGLGDGGHGVTRFNAGKLNTYLHGLNRKLQDENETIMARLREYEENYGILGKDAAPKETTAVLQSLESRRKSSGRRVSIGPSGLGDLVEDVAEGWVEEKAALEEMIDELKEDLDRVSRDKESVTREKAELEKAVEDQRDERSREKERYVRRVSELQEQAQGVVDNLELKLQDAQRQIQASHKEKIQAVKEVERRLAEVIIERDVLSERMEKAEGALESGRDLGADVNAANERVSKVLGDLKNANVQIKELEEEVMHSDERIDTLEGELREEKKLVSELERELQLKSDELSQTLDHIKSLDRDLKVVRTEIESYKVNAAQNEGDAQAAVEHIESLTEQLTTAQARLDAVTAALDEEQEKARRLEAEAERASNLAKQFEDALEAAEEKMRTDDEQVSILKVKISSLERELDKTRSHIDASHIGPDAEAQEQIESLEAELDDAHKEIARLNVLASQSPARKAMEKAKDTKISMLEQERDDLMERIKVLKNNSFMLNTPGKAANTSKISPMHRHILSMSLRSPRTPGGPLRDLSWLQSTMHDPTVTPLVTEIERLQYELERANEIIDDRLDRIEDAGVGVVSLSTQLEDAKAKIVTLEDEIARLSRKEDRRARRLEKLRCQKCLMKVDVRALEQKLMGDESSILSESSMSLEPPTPPTRTSEKLKADLEAVNSQLSSMKKQWEQERRRLVGDNAALQDATTRLNVEVRQAKSEIQRYAETERAHEKAKAGMQGELDRAKRMVDELENALKAERSRLRSLSTEQNGAQRQKEEVVMQLRRTESDMAEVRDELQRIKHENRALENELRSNATVDQKARVLEAKVTENIETIEQLRQERSLLITDHKNLQRQFADMSEHVNKLREEQASSQTSHDNRRHELDLKLLEIEDLRRALADRADDLERAEAEKNRIAHEKTDMTRNVTSLEADLRRVKHDAEAFGRDLKALRAQKDKLESEQKEERTKAERAQKQNQTEIRLLKDVAKEQKEKALALQRRWKDHVCAADGLQLDTLKLQHKEECKGLIIQIRYLKAKWTRESTMRSDLCNQKRYLLVLLARCERNEQTILAAIAQVGFPSAPVPPLAAVSRRRSLRSVAHSVVFLIRAKRASETWREQSAAKDAIAAAYQEVRRRRQTTNDNA